MTDLSARLLAAFLLLPFVAGISPAHKPRTYFPDNPKDVIRFGCVVQAHTNDPYWHTYVWALLPGNEVNCSEALARNQQTGAPIDSACYVAQFSMRDSRKKALGDCDDWMKDLHDEIIKETKKK